jgi:signal transduction histidine kinase
MDRPVRLLLVDDEEHFRDAVARRLKKRGLEVTTAPDGPAALDMLAKAPFDVVVSDVKMPKMDGLDLLRQIKAAHPGIEVILLTGHAALDDGVAGIKAGAFDYLTKPIELEQLTGKIGHAMDKILRAEEKEREAAFRRQVEEQMVVTERLAALGTLATGVAHEINNPLAIIRESAGWMTQILTKPEMVDMPRRADFQKGLGKIEAAVDRARRITHNLLGTVGKRTETVAETDLEILSAESTELAEREAAKKGVELVRRIDPAARQVRADPYSLRQALINLVHNAVQATESGTVTVAARRSGDGLQIQVTDTGSGIPAEYRKKIFEPFFTTKDPGKGTGLGLFVVRNLVQKMGGTLDVESEVGKGTTFTLSLPSPESPGDPAAGQTE